MNKKLIVAIVALLAVAGILLGVYFATRPETTEGQKSFTVTVTHADGSVKDFSYQSDEEYVGIALQKEGLISGDMEQYGLYIKIVDGEKAVFEEDNAYWSFYIGEDYALQGIDLTPIEDGAHYQLKYEKNMG